MFCIKENLKEKKKKGQQRCQRLLKVLIAAVTTFFRSAIDHQNKGPGTHKNHQTPEQLAKTCSSRRTVGVCISWAMSIVN
ncbi:hypothetical protein AB4K20DRAFT_1283194 [Rhizopus microsporus]